METAFLILCIVILLAFSVRILVWAAKLIYKYAPFIVISAVVIALMYWVETGRPITDLKDFNGTVTKKLED